MTATLVVSEKKGSSTVNGGIRYLADGDFTKRQGGAAENNLVKRHKLGNHCAYIGRV